MDDQWDFLGGHARALEQQQLLLAKGGRGASQYPDLFPVNQPNMTLAGASDSVNYPLDGNSIANSEDASQYPDSPDAKHSSATPKDAFSSSTTPTPSDTSITPLPEVLRSRPGAHERRTDGEPGVYRELPSFQSFDEPIPADATLEDICIQYPNHLRGSYLDAFIQYRWTGTDMFTHLSDKARQEFRVCGISRNKTFNNRANFLGKRLNGRISDLTAEEITALCTARKIRGCLIDGTEFYGACKLQGKFFNPAAPPVRSFPRRQNQARRGRASTAAAATKTFTLEGKKYRLWGSADELDKFKRSMATHWDRLRGYADVVVSADAVHAMSKDSQRNRLILQITNWPSNSATETFFSFDHVEDCPKFLGTINDMVTAGVVDILSLSADTNIGRQLQLARQSTIEYVLSTQVARMTSLSELVATFPVDSVNFGVVDRVLSWNGGAAQGFAPLTGAPQASFGGSMPMFQNPAGANMFAGDRSVSQVLAASFEAPPPLRNSSGGDMAMSRNPPTPNIFDVCFNSMEAEPATHKQGSLPLRPILRKRAREDSQQDRTLERVREEPAQQTTSQKRARLAQPAVPQGQGLLGRGNHAAAALMPTSTADPNEDPFAVFDDTLGMQLNTETPAAPSLSMSPEGLEMGSWPVDGTSNTTDHWDAMPADDKLLWSDVDPMGSGFTPEGILQQIGLGTALPDLPEPFQQAQPFHAGDLTFTVAPSMEDLWGEFNVDGMLGGVDGHPGENVGWTASAEMTQGSASSTMAAATEASWELPVMEDSDESWLRDSIYDSRQ